MHICLVDKHVQMFEKFTAERNNISTIYRSCKHNKTSCMPLVYLFYLRTGIVKIFVLNTHTLRV